MPPHNVFTPGTALTVGTHAVTIDKYVSEGGFATVYACKIEPAFNGSTSACLKRVVVPNKWQLTLLRQEVDAMKRLRGNAHIVSYIDSHALRLALPEAAGSTGAPQQYEVLLLMEYCLGKGLIDYMNTRLTNRLTEPEILRIMGQVTTAVAMCHHLAPPLIHRDIKIENVLLDGKGTYKLCDFGSAVEYSRAPQSPLELQTLQADIMQNTTPQYRAPEMIDLSHGFPIDDKLDIWALGVFLYKLCYYTTPFELPTQKTLQDLHALILNCSSTLRFPSSPQFSPRLQNIIHCCLRADPRRRPNALQLLQELCVMQGIKNIPDVVPYSVRLSRTTVVPTENGKAAKKPELPKRDDVARKVPPKSDAFARIDKSKILQMGKPRPKLEIFASSASVHDLVKLQVNESAIQPRKSEDNGSTLDFLRSREAEGPHSRQNTGGSFKQTLKNGLRRISTGGSLLSQRSGSFTRTSNGSERSGSDEAPKPPTGQLKRSNSIQRRVQQLLNNKEKKAPKTAAGYGKYTEQDDISAINYTNLSARASMESLSSPEVEVPESFEFNQKSGNKLDGGNWPKPTRLASMKAVIREAERPLPRLRPSTEQVQKKASPPPCPPSLSVRNSSQSLSTMADLRNKAQKKSKEETNEQKAYQKNDIKKSYSEKRETKKMEPKQVESSKSETKIAETKWLKAKKKAPPPKPAKPQHLKDPKYRRLSTSSEVSLPDLDDLERQFARRFPSYV